MNTALADMNTAPHYRIPPFSSLSNTEHAGIINTVIAEMALRWGGCQVFGMKPKQCTRCAKY